VVQIQLLGDLPDGLAELRIGLRSWSRTPVGRTAPVELSRDGVQMGLVVDAQRPASVVGRDTRAKPR
jgi:hypothetical protein